MKFGLACLLLAVATCVAQSTPQQTSAQQDPSPTAQPPANPSSSSEASSTQAPSTPPPATQPPSTQPSSTQASPGDDTKNSDKKGDGAAATSKDRLFFALPNFLTLENGSQAPPLTSGQKFKVVAKGTFDYIQIPWYAIVGAISQAQNNEAGYGQGWAGYGKRVGASAADGTIENFMVQAILPSILHQDPRYFQMGKGKTWNRLTYSATRIFVTRSDSGHKQFNFSEVFGSAISASISTYSYHPRSDRGISDVAGVWGTQMGTDALTIVLKEFWPDIRNKIMKKHSAN
jgi:hypothetical protein